MKTIGVKEKITLKEAASVSIVIITFTEKQPRYAAQEVMLLDIVHSAFMSNKCQELLRNPHRVSTESPFSSIFYM